MIFTRRTPLLRWFGLVLIALLLSACASQGDIMDGLNKTLRGYEKAVRWAEFEAVYSFHKWDDDQEASIPTNMENIRVTKYESFGQKFDQKNQIMKQTIRLRYYNTDDQRERGLKHKQEWKYFAELKRWYLISEPIVFP
jgi:hypothetical protein